MTAGPRAETTSPRARALTGMATQRNSVALVEVTDNARPAVPAATRAILGPRVPTEPAPARQTRPTTAQRESIPVTANATAMAPAMTVTRCRLAAGNTPIAPTPIAPASRPRCKSGEDAASVTADTAAR